MAKRNEVTTNEAPAVAEDANTEATSTALSGEVLEPTPPVPPKEGRAHRASFSFDKERGGYNIWIEGPSANKFAGKFVPVTRMDGVEVMEKCTKLQWTGPSPLTGQPAAVYTFVRHPRKKADDAIAF